ncbi:MAG TPA: tetratricopeptide repeat protein [Xanthobacteraceae bacterium]|nr:tetratricopeptide repeat protein [Xanthobacteraceae bacterium]
MPQNSPRAARLTQLDEDLAQHPDAIGPRYARASLLREAGRTEQAKRDYLALLERAPTHYGALNDFGTMLLATGYRDAARTVFEQAVRHHPERPDGRVNLANLLFKVGELAAARTHFEAALRLDPDHVHAHRGLANVLVELGDGAGTREHRDRGFRGHALTTLPYHGDGPPLRVLLLVSALGGNIPTAALLDERTHQAAVLVSEYADAAAALPPHDVVFNGIGDADLCGEGLAAVQAIVARTARPVVNDPSSVRATGRLANVERFRDLADVVVPRMVGLARERLLGPQADTELAEHGFGFPLLLRAPGFHTGRHFVRVERADDLAAAAHILPGHDIWAIEPLDARGADGKFRKYRVMFVERRLYPLHVAISSHWKVHYFTAEMADSAAHRHEDAAFLADMPATVGARAMAALERIAAALGLDYGGIDFALGPAGEILFFEANAAMVVTPPTDDPKWAYRRPAVERIIAAVRAMLIARANAPALVHPA